MVEVRVTLLPSTPNDPLEERVLSITTNLGSVGLDVMFPREGTFPPGNTKVLLNVKVQLLLSHFRLLGQETNRQGKK